MKPGHALAHRSGHRHKNSKGGHGRGVQRDGRGGKGRPEGEGRRRGQGRRALQAGRAACACACRPHRRGAPQQATCAKGVDARQGRWRGQAGGATPEHPRGEGDRGLSAALLAPIDRREEMPTRKVASATGAPVPARAATGRRAGGREREKRRPSDSSQRLCACEATCAKRAWLARWGETCAKRPSPGSTRHPSPTPPPAASARARAGGPRHLRAARCRPTAR